MSVKTNPGKLRQKQPKMPISSHRNSLSDCWTRNLRPALHNTSSWSLNDSNVKLIHVPTGAGFFGHDQMKSFCTNSQVNLFRAEDVQSINCWVDEVTGGVCDEFVLEWTQKTSRMEWLLPGNDLPLQRYSLSFVITAKIDPLTKLLNYVRVYWDQGSLLMQAGIFLRSLRSLSLFKPNSSETFEKIIEALPVSNDYRGLLNDGAVLMNISSSNEKQKPKIGALNNITSILNELPICNSGPAVSTPQRPASSRSINPALLNTLKLGGTNYDQPFDSPIPVNTRSVKSRNIFFEEEDEETDHQRKLNQQPTTKNHTGLFGEINCNEYRPTLASNPGAIHNSTSNIFDQNLKKQQQKFNPSLNLNENFAHQYESRIFSPTSSSPTKAKCVNLAQTDKIIFESHVFDGMKPESELATTRAEIHVATAPPQCPSNISTPLEDLNAKFIAAPVSQLRPSMVGHFKGSLIGSGSGSGSLDDENEDEKFIPSTTIRFDPNRSQIVLGDSSEDLFINHKLSSSFSAAENYQFHSNQNQIHLPTIRKQSFDPNRSQICLGDYDETKAKPQFQPTSRVSAPPGGNSSIQL